MLGVVLLVGTAVAGRPPMSPLDAFRSLSSSDVRSIQFFFELLNRGSVVPGYLMAVDTSKADPELFSPYAFWDRVQYTTDPERSYVIAITAVEARAAIDSLVTVPLIRNSGVYSYERDRGLALALSIGMTGHDTTVYHCAMHDGLANEVIPKLMGAWSRNGAALHHLKWIGIRTGVPAPVDLSQRVDVRLGKFKTEKSGMPASRIAIRNRGPAIKGRVIVVLQPAKNVQIVSAVGTTLRIQPSGCPYVVLQDSGVIESGTKREITVRIVNPDNVPNPIREARVFIANGDR